VEGGWDIFGMRISASSDISFMGGVRKTMGSLLSSVCKALVFKTSDELVRCIRLFLVSAKGAPTLMIMLVSAFARASHKARLHE
jgi:uncharacterized membrane protein